MNIGEILPGDGAKCISVKTKIDTDTVVTLGHDDHGFFSEVYTGENYVVGSSKRSYSRCYRGKTKVTLFNNIPAKHVKTALILWEELRKELINNHNHGKIKENN